MNLETAQRIVDEAVTGRKRWGLMWESQYSSNEVLDALVVVQTALDDTRESVPRDEHLLVMRQLAASQAREAKLNKLNAELREDKRLSLEA